MKKKFDLTEMKRGKELSDIASKLENIDEQTKDIIKEINNNPSQGNINNGVIAINNDTKLSIQEKQLLVNNLRANYTSLFNFSNCPDDYESLKQEAKFLSGISQHSFLVMAQRLLKIKDKRLYEEDGYLNFKSFVESELSIARTTTYCYIDVLMYFFDGGVQSTEHEIDYNIHYSKLFSVLPILKSSKEKIPKEKLKTQFLKDINKKSANEIKQEARELKIKYGLIVEKEPQSIYEKMENMIIKITDSPNAKDKIIIKNIIKKLKSYLSEDSKTKKSKDDDTTHPNILTL